MKSKSIPMNVVWRAICTATQSNLDDAECNLDDALNEFTFNVMSRCINNISGLEYSVNQAIATHRIFSPADSDVQLSILPAEMGISILPNVDNPACTWQQYIKVDDNKISIRNLTLKCYIRTSALNRIFGVDDQLSKQLYTIFGQMYHSIDICVPSEIDVVDNGVILHSVDEICQLLFSNVKQYVVDSSWIQTYLSKYVSMLPSD